MKKIIICLSAALALAACSLDREPLDPTVNTTFDQDAVFAKCYATFGLTGQSGPSGNGDVDGVDEGASAFYRVFWELNEFPTDEGWWIWNDAGLADIRTLTWTVNNDLVYGLYSRFYFDITLCNSFLEQTEDMTDTKTLAQRAEVRMLRAINYYYLLDMFYSVPFSTTVSSKKPEPYTRSQLFSWLETELLDLSQSSDIISAGTRSNKYRVDQACAWFLLMRLYLNSEVYNETSLGAHNGTPRYADAKNYALRLINSSYQLYGYDKSSEQAVDKATERTADHVYFSAYQQLFMGDNDREEVAKEAIFMIYQDAIQCQSWGGARFCLSAFRDANFVPCGSTNTWSCFRTSPEFVSYFVNLNEASSIRCNEYQMPVRLKDDRAIMASVNADGSKKMSLTGNEASDFYASWSVLKFTGIYSTAQSIKGVSGADSIQAPWVWTSPVGEPKWPDTDIPLFRLAEAYMTAAEACYRTGEDGLKYVNALRRRAHAADLTSLNDETLLAEWSREFYCEGRRRTDLIRFGQFAGPSSTKTWEGHKAGKSAKYNVYPIPQKDVTANENLKGINESIGY